MPTRIERPLAKLSALAAALGFAIATSAQAQAPQALPAAMPPPVDAVVKTVDGNVKQWLINPNGDVDGMLLDDGTQVTFPPHLSPSLTQVVKLKDKVEIAGSTTIQPTATSRPVVMRAQSIKNAASGRSVVDQPPQPGMAPPAPRDPSALTAMSANGRVTRLLYGPRGDVNGAMIDSGAIVRFPPRAETVNSQPLKVGSPLYAMGYGTRNDYGSALEATKLGTSAETAKEVFGPPRVALPSPPAAPDASTPRAP